MKEVITYIKDQYWVTVAIAAALPGIITAAVEYTMTGGSSGLIPLSAAAIGGGLTALILMAIKTPYFPSAVVEYIMTGGAPRWIPLGIVIGVGLTALILMATNTSDSPSKEGPLPGPSSEEEQRIFSPRTPAELVDKLEGLTEVQAERLTETYLGQWMEVEGNVTDISRNLFEDQIKVHIFNDRLSLFLHFDASTWGVQVGSLDVGDQISAIGKIRSILRQGIISLDECELVS